VINYNRGARHLFGKDFERWKNGETIAGEDFKEAVLIALGEPEKMYWLCEHSDTEALGHFQEDYVGSWCPGLIEDEGWSSTV